MPKPKTTPKTKKRNLFQQNQSFDGDNSDETNKNQQDDDLANLREKAEAQEKKMKKLENKLKALEKEKKRLAEENILLETQKEVEGTPLITNAFERSRRTAAALIFAVLLTSRNSPQEDIDVFHDSFVEETKNGFGSTYYPRNFGRRCG